MDGHGQLWYVDGPGNRLGKVVVDIGCPAAEAVDVAAASAVSWPAFECTSEVVVDTDEDRERFHHEAFLNTHNVSGAMALDYSTMDASECGEVNFDVLLMEGFICHVCLPNPCTNGGRCLHHDGIYTFGGFSCDCDGTGYMGDICQAAQTTNYVAAELVLDLSIEAVTGAARQDFVSKFREDVAVLAQVEASQVVVDDIRAGSVVVEFRIVSAAPGSPSTTPSAALDFLQETLLRGARMDRVGVEIDGSVLAVTAHVDESGNSVPVEPLGASEGQVASPASLPAGQQEDEAVIVPWLLLGGVVCCCALCFVVFYYVAGRRTRRVSLIIVEPELNKLESIRTTTPPHTPDPESQQAPRQLRLAREVRGIVNSRTGVTGRREFKVRWTDGQDSWVDATTVAAHHITKYDARKAARGRPMQGP
jgi:hypothetical protein